MFEMIFVVLMMFGSGVLVLVIINAILEVLKLSHSYKQATYLKDSNPSGNEVDHG